MNKEITLIPATANDRMALIALLQTNKLPTQDLPWTLDNFILTLENGKITGAAGLEILGDYALLRSVAVAINRQGSGLGKLLYQAVMKLAAEKKIGEVYLITTTAAAFFEKLGFIHIERSLVPEPIKQTAQFSSICPSSSTIMFRSIQ